MQTIVWHAIGSLVTNVDLNAHNICNFPPFMHRGFQILFHYLPVLYPAYPSVQYLRVVYARTHCDFNKLNHIFMTIIILSERGICDGVFNLFGFTMYFHLNQFASQRFAHTAGFAANAVSRHRNTSETCVLSVFNQHCPREKIYMILLLLLFINYKLTWS